MTKLPANRPINRKDVLPAELWVLKHYALPLSLPNATTLVGTLGESTPIPLEEDELEQDQKGFLYWDHDNSGLIAN